MSASEQIGGSDSSPSSIRDSWEAAANGDKSGGVSEESRTHSTSAESVPQLNSEVAQGETDDTVTDLPKKVGSKQSGSHDHGGSSEKVYPGSHDSKRWSGGSDRFSAISSLDNSEVREEDNVAAETLQQLIGQIEKESAHILKWLTAYKAQYDFLMTVVSYLEGIGILADSQFREDIEQLQVDHDTENTDGYSGKKTGPYNNIA